MAYKQKNSPFKQKIYKVNNPVGREFFGPEGAKKRQALQDKERASRSAYDALDVTGFSSRKAADRGFENLYSMATEKGVKWDSGRAVQDALDMASAIPIAGRLRAGINLSKKAISTVASKITGSLAAMGSQATKNALNNNVNKTMTKTRTNAKRRML